MSDLGRIGKTTLAGLITAALGAGMLTKAEAQVVPVPMAVATPASVTGFATSSPFVGGVSAAGCAAATSTASGGSIPLFVRSGTAPNYGDGCPGYQAILSSPGSAAVDAYGNVFFIDQGHFTIRVVYEGGANVAQAIVNANPQTSFLTTTNLVKGNVYNLVGGMAASPSTTQYCNGASGAGPNPNNSRMDGCPGGEAYILPRALVLDADGNVFFSSVANTSSVQVLYITGSKAKTLIVAANAGNTTPLAASSVATGNVYLIAGSTAGTGHTEGVLGPAAWMDSPRGLFVDGNEDVFVAGNNDNVVEEINGTTGIIATVAGKCVPVAGTNGQCESAQADSEPAAFGDGGPATSAMFNDPYSVAVDSYGNLFIADSGENTVLATPVYGRVRVVYAGGMLPGITSPQVGYIYTYAGGGALPTTNLPAQQVEFDSTYGLSFDPSGALYVSDIRHLFTTGSNHIWRIDPVTGIATIVAGNGGSSYTTFNVPCNGVKGPVVTDKYGDGCPATQSVISQPFQSYAFDRAGNAYLGDQGYTIIHKYTYGTNFPTEPVGTASTAQYVAFDMPAGTVTTSLGFSVEGATSTEFADVGATTDSCTLPSTFAVDTTCAFDVTFTPAKPGVREGVVQVNGATSALGTEFMNGTGSAVALTVDPGTMATLGTGITPEGVAVDEVGNAYLSDGKGNQVLKVAAGGGTAAALVTGLNAPRQVTVDGQGTVYVADSANNRIVRKPVTGATTYLGTGLKSPQGVAVDGLGNVYVADTGNARVVKLGAMTGVQTSVYLTGLTTPSSLAIDVAGDLYVVDTGAKAVVELPFGGIQQAVTLPSAITAPVAMCVDSAGDYYVADSAAQQVIEVPVGGGATTSLLATTAPVGLACDAAGGLYLADSSQTSVAADYRTIGSLTMPTTNIGLQSIPVPLTVTNTGNGSFTLATPVFTETGAATSFVVSGSAMNPCTAAAVLASGANCGESVVFKPQTAPSTLSAALQYTGTTTTANLTGVSTNLVLTTTVVTQSPANPVLLGQPVTFTVKVTPASGTILPTGNVLIYIDGTLVSTQSVGNGTVTYATSTLTATTHTVTASYVGDALYAASNGSDTVTVIKIPTVLSCSVVRGVGGYTDTATLTPQALDGAPTGTVTFYADGTSQAVLPIGSGVVSDLLALADGTHVITATYSGDSNYVTSSCSPTSITVLHAATVTALTATAEPVAANTSGAGILLTATVTSATAGTISGTVKFYNAGTLLGTGTVNASGVATVTTTTTVFPTYTFTALYSGDGNYLPSSGAITESADFVIVPVNTQSGALLSGPLGVPGHGQTMVTLVIYPINGYTGTLSGSCTNLPTNAICRFPVPAGSVLATGNVCSSLFNNNDLTAAQQDVPCVPFQIYTGINASVASVSHGANHSWLATMLGWPIAAGMLLVIRRRRLAKGLQAILGAVILLALGAGLVGCGSNGINTPVIITPAGSDTMSVTLTDTNQISHTVALPITVAAD